MLTHILTNPQQLPIAYNTLWPKFCDKNINFVMFPIIQAQATWTDRLLNMKQIQCHPDILSLFARISHVHSASGLETCGKICGKQVCTVVYTP